MRPGHCEDLSVRLVRHRGSLLLALSLLVFLPGFFAHSSENFDIHVPEDIYNRDVDDNLNDDATPALGGLDPSSVDAADSEDDAMLLDLQPKSTKLPSAVSGDWAHKAFYTAPAGNRNSAVEALKNKLRKHPGLIIDSSHRRQQTISSNDVEDDEKHNGTFAEDHLFEWKRKALYPKCEKWVLVDGTRYCDQNHFNYFQGHEKWDAANSEFKPKPGQLKTSLAPSPPTPSAKMEFDQVKHTATEALKLKANKNIRMVHERQYTRSSREEIRKFKDECLFIMCETVSQSRRHACYIQPAANKSTSCYVNSLAILAVNSEDEDSYVSNARNGCLGL
jgi:hypothetical protein